MCFVRITMRATTLCYMLKLCKKPPAKSKNLVGDFLLIFGKEKSFPTTTNYAMIKDNDVTRRKSFE